MTRNTRLFARYWNWVKRLGKKKALVALGLTLLRIIYHILSTKKPFMELSTEYLAQHQHDRELRRQAKLIQELEAKGFIVSKV
jgi:hypothetical protein